MDPTIWGPPLWYQMHMKTFAFNPKKSDKQKIIQYFENIKNNLPCENCKVHCASLAAHGQAIARFSHQRV